MTTHERLYCLVDVLPDAELHTAARVLKALVGTLDPAARTTLLAINNDDELESDERAGVAEARADLAAGRPARRPQAG